MVDVANIHLPVLLDDCVNLMAPALEHENAIAVDCTLGLAGHSIAFLKAAPQARLIGIDRDSEALGLATERMEREGLADRFIPVHAAFDQLDQVLADQDIERVDAVFMDLGLSSLQIDETDRGFSYSHDAPLDMRMDVSQPLTAERILATYDAAELVRIFKEYGEERFSRQIARAIVARRDKEPFTTTAQLNRLVDEVVPQAHRPAGNPAKRVFQALRIEVNGELINLRHQRFRNFLGHILHPDQSLAFRQSHQKGVMVLFSYLAITHIKSAISAKTLGHSIRITTLPFRLRCR